MGRWSWGRISRPPWKRFRKKSEFPLVKNLKNTSGSPEIGTTCWWQVDPYNSIRAVPGGESVLRLSLGRRLVNLLPVAQRTTAFTGTFPYGIYRSTTKVPTRKDIPYLLIRVSIPLTYCYIYHHISPPWIVVDADHHTTIKTWWPLSSQKSERGINDAAIRNKERQRMEVRVAINIPHTS